MLQKMRTYWDSKEVSTKFPCKNLLNLVKRFQNTEHSLRLFEQVEDCFYFEIQLFLEWKQVQVAARSTEGVMKFL